MPRLFALLFIVCCWFGSAQADQCLSVAISPSTQQLSDFARRLEGQLGCQVKLLESRDFALEGWLRRPLGADLALLEKAPSLSGNGRRRLLGLVPLASGQIYYLYYLKSLTASQQAGIESTLTTWLRPYRAGEKAPSSNIKSIVEAVFLARKGNYQPALDYLYQYLEKHHRDRRAHAETLVVLEWAGRHRAATILALSRPDLKLPLYAIKSVARSARAAQFFTDAQNYVATGLEIASADVELISLQIHLLGDQRKLDDGLRVAEQALQKYPRKAELWLAKYYLHVLRGESYSALDAVQRAYELTPSRYAQRELIYSLERCGMPQLALQESTVAEELLSVDDKFRLQRAVNAQQTRWGVYPQERQEDHYRETDLALQENVRLTHALTYSDSKQPSLHQQILWFDRIVALRDRRHMTKVIELWQQLSNQRIELPDYALQAVADALLYLQRPQQAAELYAKLAERNPNNFEARLGLYYSLHEANQFERATALIERLVEEQAVWDRSKGYRTPEENPNRFRAELAAALDRLYRNEFDVAEQRLRKLYRLGPHSSELRKALGELENSRRHPRRAQQLFEQGLANEPQHAGLQVALADSFLVRRQWRLAEQSIARLARLYPDEGFSLRLQDEWQRRNQRQLEGRISLGFGDSPNVDGQEIEWMLRNWTRPLDYGWRLAAFAQQRYGKLPEGHASRLYGGVAFERLTPDLDLFGQLAVADSAHERVLAELSGRYEWSDQWAGRFSLSRNSQAVSLRALDAGIGGTELRLGGEWWRTESLSATLELTLLDYDDGNTRTAVAAAQQRRLRSGPTFQLVRILRAAISGNSQPGGPYFAPETDLLLEAELQARWISWRHYADSFTQRASVASGGYWQQNYGWSLPIAVSYAHEWELRRRRLLVEYGPSLSRRDYDGAAELNFGFYLAFSWRY